jgi:mercuric ion transport protein
MPKLKIEFIYEKTCPNIAAARAQLQQACAITGISAEWQEWEVSAADAPDYIHGYGSPTILINQKDINGEVKTGDDYCCRVYSHAADTNKGVPAVDTITNAINAAMKK